MAERTLQDDVFDGDSNNATDNTLVLVPNNNSTNETTTDQEDTSSSLSCPLVGFLPFTAHGLEWGFYGLGESTSWSYTHMVAALMAVDHFNEKNPAVVPDIEELSQNCTVYMEDPVFANTDFHVAEVAKFLIDQAYDNVRYCGIVGPYANDPALEAANLASGLDIPMVTHNADDTRLTGRFVNPHVASVNVNLNAQSEAIVNFFRRYGRTDFLATIAITATFGDQFQSTMDSAAKEAGFEHLSTYTIAPPWSGFEPNRGIGVALQNVKRDGYRNIFLVLNDLSQQLQLVADHAEEFELNTGEQMWIISGNVNAAELAWRSSQNSNITKLVQGMALVRTLDGFEGSMARKNSDRFLESWKTQDSAFVDRVNRLHPIKRPNAKGYFQGEPSYFETQLPEHGAGFMYDAVMAQALGRCQQQLMDDEEEENTGARHDSSSRNRGRRRRVKGEDSTKIRRRAKKQIETNLHLEGIFSVEFDGATGRVVFGEGFIHPGNRKRETVTYGAYNFRASRAEELSMNSNYTTWPYLTNTLSDGPVTGKWAATEYAPFIFASGLSTPPDRNHDVPEQNYLSQSVQIAGLCFFGLAIALTIASTLFIFVNRKKAIVRQSQPVFLFILMLGCVSMTMAIITFSFDEQDGWSDQMLDRACIASPWLISLGYISIYCALFSKLWRINQVLQFARRKVGFRHVVGPFAFLVMCNIAVLVVWTLVDPFVWERSQIDDETVESYGRCASEHSIIYVLLLVTLMAVSTAACAIMAWKTKDVDSRFSESKWIFYTIFVQIQVLLLGIPVLVILDTASADATYLGRVLVIFLVVMTTLVLMIGPKVAEQVSADTETRRNSSMSGGGNRSMRRSSTRGSNVGGGGTRVSGVTIPSSYQSRDDHSNDGNSILITIPAQRSVQGTQGSRAFSLPDQSADSIGQCADSRSRTSGISFDESVKEGPAHSSVSTGTGRVEDTVTHGCFDSEVALTSEVDKNISLYEEMSLKD